MQQCTIRDNYRACYEHKAEGQFPGLFRALRAFSGSTPPVPVAGVPRGSAEGKKTPARGRGPKPHSGGRGGDYPLEAMFLPSVVNNWRTGPVLPPGLRPAVRRPVLRTAVSTSEPPALPGLRVYSQDYLGAGIVPTPQPR